VRAYTAAAEGGAAGPYVCGTFTVVNLGMYGVKSAAPVVAMPQAAVLGLGAIEQRVLPNDAKDAKEIYRLAEVLTGALPRPAAAPPPPRSLPCLAATCSFDHRVVDGAVGAQWLAAFKKLVENPITMLL
jgi:pyruvate dehydrogenase E2 component (dihydrolipoamide acetyltransferase)